MFDTDTGTGAGSGGFGRGWAGPVLRRFLGGASAAGSGSWGSVVGVGGVCGGEWSGGVRAVGEVGGS